MIAEKEAQNHPGGRRGQHHCAHHRRVEIAHDLLERKHYCGQRRIECGRDGCRRSYWDQVFYLLGAQPEEASEYRTNACAHLN